MPLFNDQIGRTIVLERAPQRIVSLVPSQTELLYHLGLETEVIAVTKFCVHPATWLHRKTRIGGTKQLKIDLIQSLEPDLIIANKEENVKEQVEELAEDFPTWISDVHDLPSALNMIRQVGSITGKTAESERIVLSINTAFAQLPTSNLQLRTLYLIWQDPYMTVGADTFIHAMMETAGFNSVSRQRERYPELTITEMQGLNPEFILLSSEPFPFAQKHIEELQPHFPSAKIILVDGEMFSWYGSRLLCAPEYFQKLHQDIA